MGIKNYQQNAVNDLFEYGKIGLRSSNTKPILLCAPTGSGKTYMMTCLIKKMIQEYKGLDLCFIWMSIGKNQLHKQSYNKLSNDSEDVFECKFLDELNFADDEAIEQNQVIFLDWDSLNKKDKKTGKSVNSLLSETENNNFINYINSTHKLRKIIMIIDESHVGTETDRSIEIKNDIIQPDLIIEMSATPMTKEYQARVDVSPTDVIREAMIKNEILINPELDNIPKTERTSETLILEAAFKKREELVKKYKKLKRNVNPLVLIQVPNSELGDRKRDTCIKFFEKKGITVNNKKLAICYGDDEIDKESKDILSLNGKIEFLIFKVKLDTGWDCPRAQILVRFRETSSVTFEVQTLGRIIRMPEPNLKKYYDEVALNKAYVYTNIQSIIVKKEDYNPNIIKTLHSIRNNKYKNIKLKSYYKNRIDFGDITNEDKPSEHIETAFLNKLGIDDRNKQKQINAKITKTIDLNTKNIDKIIINEKIDSKDIDTKKQLELGENSLDVNYSLDDLQYVFDKIIIKNLNGFAPARSKSKIKTSIFSLFKKYFNIDLKGNGIDNIEKIVVKNNDFFSDVIDTACKNLKTVHNLNILSKQSGKWSDFEIPEEKYYNEHAFQEFPSKLSLHQPLYLDLTNNKLNQLEVDFIKYLNSKSKYIDWFWKNGKEHNIVNFGIDVHGKDAFRPDFIIKFKNGKIGIFDTKAVGQNERDTKEKADALINYIIKQKKKYLIGGMVIKKKNNTFMYINKVYESFDQKPELWHAFDDLLKK